MKENNAPIPLLGVSKQLVEIRKTIEKVAKFDATVLIRGESGVGKEVVAKWIHFLSLRKDQPFVAVNAAAIPENLIESEIFGYERGAFSGAESTKKGKLEIADGGTFFLDEIGDLPIHLNVKLLRVLQEKVVERLGSNESIPVDVRFLAATNKNLEEMIAEGKFREDLYYRLNVITITIPPLRERKEDIDSLVLYFFERDMGYLPEIDREVFEYLKTFDWYGNIRELANNIRRVVIFNEGKKRIKLKDLKPYIKPVIIEKESDDNSLFEYPYKEAISLFKKEYIKKMLAKTGWKQREAAKRMGILPTYLSKLIKDLNIKRD